MGGAESPPASRSSIARASRRSAFPDTAAHGLQLMWRYAYNLQALYETPTLPTHADAAPERRAAAAAIVAAARERGRTVLTEVESKQMLAAYGIPTVETHVAATEDEAVAAAEAIGFPVVLKLHSHTITHKTDVGGVKLNLADAVAVGRAFMKSIARVRRSEPGPGTFRA